MRVRSSTTTKHLALQIGAALVAGSGAFAMAPATAAPTSTTSTTTLVVCARNGTKVLTLALSAFLAGTGGGFYAFYFRYVDPDAVLNIGLSMEMVFIAMVGGLGTVMGPLAGAVFLTAIAEVVRERFQVGHLIFYGLFMMLAIRYMPEGIWGRARRLLSTLQAKAPGHGAA